LPEHFYSGLLTVRQITRQPADASNLFWLLGLRLRKQNEKESRDEPKELWIHGRAYLWAMDMPQSKRNENRYFSAKEGR